MGLSDGDNRASSGAGPATHNHSRYTDTDTPDGWMSEEGRLYIYNKDEGEEMLCW